MLGHHSCCSWNREKENVKRFKCMGSSSPKAQWPLHSTLVLEFLPSIVKRRMHVQFSRSIIPLYSRRSTILMSKLTKCRMKLPQGIYTLLRATCSPLPCQGNCFITSSPIIWHWIHFRWPRMFYHLCYDLITWNTEPLFHLRLNGFLHLFGGHDLVDESDLKCLLLWVHVSQHQSLLALPETDRVEHGVLEPERCHDSLWGGRK